MRRPAPIQILRYLHPEVLPDEHIRQLNKIGMNHICFRVDDIKAEVANIRAAGFQTRNEIIDSIRACWFSSTDRKA